MEKNSELITRPPNAWVLYMKDKRKELLLDGSKIPTSELIRHIGILWKDEREEVLNRYSNLSKIGQVEHQKDNPLYRIHDRRKRKRMDSDVT